MVTNRCPSAARCAAFARGWRAAILPGLLFLGACYAYGPPRGPVPAAGTHVSIRLSGDAARDLALELGPGVSYVEGLVIADDSAGLHLAVSRVEGRGDVETPWTGERVTFAHNTYLSLEERHLSVPGTLLMGGLAVGAVVALREAFFGTGGTANSPPGGLPNPTQ